MKHINYSLWWWFVYQWWVWAFIKHTIDTYHQNDTNYTKSYSIDIKKLLSSSFENNNLFDNFFSEASMLFDSKDIAMFLEWDPDCFEDINLLYNNQNWQTTALFIQVKGWNEILLKDWKVKKTAVLNDTKKIQHLFSNFLKNVNIYQASNNSKFILISNKHFDNNIINISKWWDLTLVVNKIIAEVRKKFRYQIKTNWRSIKKLEKLIYDIYNGVIVKKRMFGTTLPFKNQEDQDNIVVFIKNTIAIINRTVVLQNFKLENIHKKMSDDLWVEWAHKIFNLISEKSVDIETIESISPQFDNYLKYNLLFKKNEETNDITEIREWKFL